MGIQQWGSKMINLLRLLGRVERLFVSGLRKNIVALLVQCAVVGGVTLQEHKQRCGMPKPTSNPGLLHPHTSCVYFFDWATCTPTETNKTETSKPSRGHINDTPRGWVDVIPHPLEHPRIAPRPPHVPVPGAFSLSAQRSPQRWSSLTFIISLKLVFSISF